MNKSTQYALISFAATAVALALAHRGTVGTEVSSQVNKLLSVELISGVNI
jgi:hypothetical protein